MMRVQRHIIDGPVTWGLMEEIQLFVGLPGTSTPSKAVSVILIKLLPRGPSGEQCFFIGAKISPFPPGRTYGVYSITTRSGWIDYPT